VGGGGVVVVAARQAREAMRESTTFERKEIKWKG